MTLHIHLKFPDGDSQKPPPKPPQCQNDPCVWHPKNEPLIDSDEMGGIPVPAPPPPATDPHDGWFVLLKDGCAMPKNGATVDVTIGNEEDDRWVERCSYLPSANTAPGQYGFDVDLYEGEFLVAWRAAPKPFRGGV